MSNIDYVNPYIKMNNNLIEYSLFDEFINVPNYCVQYIYETILYIYAGTFYQDLEWLANEYRMINLDFIANLIPLVTFVLFFLQSFIIMFDGVYSDYFPIDYIFSDTHIVNTTILNCPSYLIRYFPELMDIVHDKRYAWYYTPSEATKYILKVENMEIIESFSSGYTIYFTLCLVIFYITLMYTAIGQKYNKEESHVDGEYLTLSTLTEAEKEIGSLDDCTFFFFNLIYLFGWFFGTYAYLIISRLPELIFFMYAIPGIFYIALAIPTYLSYDYGLIYGCYLRGTGGTASLIYELGYDYIAIAIFYIRLILQGIRLLIMILTYASFHDYMLFYNITPSSFMDPSYLFVNRHNFNFVQLQFYYLVVSIPGTLIYYGYEIIHLFFVVTSQTVAFFAIIFWLFLFLYTFFFAARVEKYFLIRRAEREILWNKIYSK